MKVSPWYAQTNLLSPRRRPRVGRNIDKGALIAHTTMYNKIHLNIQILRSILRVPKWVWTRSNSPPTALKHTTETALGPRFATGVSPVKISATSKENLVHENMRTSSGETKTGQPRYSAVTPSAIPTYRQLNLLLVVFVPGDLAKKRLLSRK